MAVIIFYLYLCMNYVSLVMLVSAIHGCVSIQVVTSSSPVKGWERLQLLHDPVQDEVG